MKTAEAGWSPASPVASARARVTSVLASQSRAAAETFFALVAAATDMPAVLAGPTLAAAQTGAALAVGVGVDVGDAAVGVGVGVGVTVGVGVAVAVSVVGVGLGVSLSDSLALGLDEGDGAAVGSSSEQALSASTASRRGATVRVTRRVDRTEPRCVMASL